LSIAIVGPPASGKSTLFRALTSRTDLSGESHSHNEPVPGILRVSDERLERLAEIVKPKRTVHPTFELLDIPGSPWEAGKGRESIAQCVRQAEAFLVVLPAFDPTRDTAVELAEMMTEMIISDLAQVEKRLDRMKKEQAAGLELDVVKAIYEHLSKDQPIRSISFTENEEEAIRGYCFLSQKPLVIIVNRAEEDTRDCSDLLGLGEESGMPVVETSAALDEELGQLTESEQQEMLAELGLDRAVKDRLIDEIYKLWNFITFLTANPNECRAWPVPEGITALRAAGKIHSDMERGFIKAEVAAFDDFEELGGITECRSAGKLRLEGKEYRVQDGDIITFRFNV